MEKKFCPECGVPRKPESRFCGSCGKSFATQNEAGAASVSPQPAAQSSPGSWQVFVGDKLPELMAVSGMPAGGVFSTLPIGTQKTGAPLSKTVWTVAITTATDLVTAYASGNPVSRQSAYLRGGLAVMSLVSGLLAGNKRGWMSRIVMASSLGIAFVQSGSIFSFAGRLLENPQMLSGVLPTAVTQSLSFLAALRSVWVARG